MSQTVQEFFSELGARADRSKIADMSNSYLFDIEGAGKWKVSVDHGAVEVAEGGGEADATISTTRELFERILAGEQNPTIAYMTGKMKVRGNLEVVARFRRLLE